MALTRVVFIAVFAVGCTRYKSVVPRASAQIAEPVRASVAATDSAPGVVRGVVRDSATGAPVEAMQVMLLGTVNAAITDATGRFALAAQPPGDYALRARRIGYEPAVVYFTLPPGRGALVELRMPRRVRRLEFQSPPAK